MVVLLAGPFCFGASEHGQFDGRDRGAGVEEVLRKAREYSNEYLSRLPDFLCVQTTRQFQSGNKGERWKEGDTFTSKLVFVGGHEKRTLVTVNGRQPDPSRRRAVRRPLTTEGEFGILLGNVLGENSPAEFAFVQWNELHGRETAVFHYRISRERSTLKLSLSDLAQAVVPYQGDIFADARDGRVWRITCEADDIPEELDTRSIQTGIDYTPVSIGGTEYLLPDRAVVLLRTRRGRIRNELTFGEYRKFETRSSITYGPEAGGNGPPQ